MMKSCVGFIGLLACGNCNHISRSRPDHINARQRHKSISDHISITSIRGGGGGGDLNSSTQLNLSAAATMSSLFAGSVGGAVGVGIAYPFDTLSTKAQVRSGKSDEQQTNLIQNIKTIWANEGIQGFFEGVFVTVSARLTNYLQ